MGSPIGMGRALSAWNDIRVDVRAIRQAVMGSAKGQRFTPGQQSDRRATATPVARDGAGRFVRRDAPGAASDSRPAVLPTGRTKSAIAQAAAQPATRRTSSPVTPMDGSESPSGRDERGRFSGGTSDGRGAERAGDGVLRGLLDRLTGAASSTGGALENADPAVKAFQEVAQPLARGYGMLTGNRDEKRKEGWFRRIYGSLAGFRKEESVFNKAANKSLKSLEDRPVADGARGGGGFAGLIAGLSSRILPILGAVFRGFLLPIAGVIAAWNAGQWIGEKIYAWMDKAGITTIIFDAFDDIKTYVGKGWDGAVSAFKAMGEGIGKAWISIASLFTQAYAALKSLPVIGPAIQLAEQAAAKAREATVAATTAVKNAPQDFQKGMKEQADPIRYSPPVLSESSGRNLNDPRRLDRTTAVNSDGRMMNDPRRLDAQPLDGLEPAASVAQRAGRFAGGIRKLLGVDGTKRMYENTDGSTETRSGGSVSWRNNNPGNLKFEHAGSADATVKNTRTKAQALKSAQANYDGVVDLDQWGNAIFSTEEAGRAAKAKLLTGKHGGKTIEEMLPKYAVNDYSGKANHAAYAAGIYKTAEGQGADLRGKKIGDLNPQEMNALLDGMKKVEGFKTGTVTGGSEVSVKPVAVPAIAMPVQTSHAPIPRAPSFAAPPPIADAPPVINPLGTGADSKKSITVSLAAQDVGQDVRSRGIAHVATGGLSGGSGFA